MNSIRRIYVYVVSLASLAVLATAVASLGQLMVQVLVGEPIVSQAEYVRQQVAGWGAAAVVALPVWLGHWALAQRWAKGAAAEKASTLRRLFLYAVLAGAMLAAAVATQGLLRGLLYAVSGTDHDALRAAAEAVPELVVSAVVWLVHARVTAADRALVGEAGGSATLRRWYVYGSALVGFVLLLEGLRELLEQSWRATLQPLTNGVPSVLDPIPAVAVSLAVWLAHWRLLPRAAGAEVERDDQHSTLRSVYLFLGLAVAVAGTLSGASQLLYYALGRVLGVATPGGVGGDLALAAAGPGSTLLAYGAGWVYQRWAIRASAAAASTARQNGVRRLYVYVVALFGLAASCGGVVGLLWTVSDALANPPASPADWWQDRVALFATLIIVGLPTWLAHWRPSPSSPERAALSRRIYLYVVLIAGVLGLLGSAISALSTLLNAALGEQLVPSEVSSLLHMLAVALVAVGVAGYHWRVLRQDIASPAGAHEPPGQAELLVRLRAPDQATLENALRVLREAGVEVKRSDIRSQSSDSTVTDNLTSDV